MTAWIRRNKDLLAVVVYSVLMIALVIALSRVDMGLPKPDPNQCKFCGVIQW